MAGRDGTGFKMSPDVARLNPGVAGEISSCPPASKYHNTRTEVRGLIFQSGHEAAVIKGLMLAEEAKQIFGLRLQVRFPLEGNVIYVADATYLDDKLQAHVIDAKGMRTREYINKAKQFKARYGQAIEEL